MAEYWSILRSASFFCFTIRGTVMLSLVSLKVIEINLSSMVPHVSGPKRPQDRVAVSSMKEDFQSCLNEKVTYQSDALGQQSRELILILEIITQLAYSYFSLHSNRKVKLPIEGKCSTYGFLLVHLKRINHVTLVHYNFI